MNEISLSNGIENTQAVGVFGGLLNWLGRKGLSEEVRFDMRSRLGGI